MRSPAADPATGTAAAHDRAFLGHPRGLAVLAFTEAWERFSFYGMQTLLVLYMVDLLLTPGHAEHVLGLSALRRVLEAAVGHLPSQAFASMIFGLYSGLAYFLPVFGGLLGDRLVGQHRMVTLGATLMAVGHLLMAFEAPFLLALLLLIVGSGCLKGNITTQVGSLYSFDDRRRTDAFQIFQFGINIGVVAAPFVCGTLGELYGWHYGFGAAGIGMLIGLAIYLTGKRHLPPDRRGRIASSTPARLGNWRGVAALFFVLLVVVLFLVPGNQMGNVYPLWIRDHIDRHAGAFQIPVTWFLSGTAIASLALPPLILRIWSAQAARGTEWDEVGKLRFGTGIATLAYALLAAIATFGGDGASWLWLVGYHAMFAVAYLFIWPVGVALFARAAPPGANAMFIGIFYTSVFFANNVVGVVGGWYGRMTPGGFWTLQAGIGLCGFVLILVFGGLVRHVLGERE